RMSRRSRCAAPASMRSWTPRTCSRNGFASFRSSACCRRSDGQRGAALDMARVIFHNVLGLVLALTLMSCVAVEGVAAPRARLVSPHWLANDPASSEHVDHGAWDRFLGQYLTRGGDGVNRIAYARALPQGRDLLERYIAALEAVPVSHLARAEQRAYWINLYNAETTAIILAHYPVASIRDISLGPGLFDVGPWAAKLLHVEGEALSLDDIEHGILRPIWRDARIHYALNCAALSCPSLMPEAFTAGNSEALLDAGARGYVNNPRGVRIADNRLILSSIYLWYREDFGD